MIRLQIKEAGTIGIDAVVVSVKRQMRSRAFRVSNELRNQAMEVLRGPRSGRTYRKPHSNTRYTASAPGEPPAVRTGDFRRRWERGMEESDRGKQYRVVPYIENRLYVGRHHLATLLEGGTRFMAPRPYQEKIRERAYRKAVRIYREPYL